MNDLLQKAVDAHGGLKRWNEISCVKVAASLTGDSFGNADGIGRPILLEGANVHAVKQGGMISFSEPQRK